MTESRINRERLDRLFQVKVDGLYEKQRYEKNELHAKFSKQGLLNSGIFLNAVLSLCISQIRQLSEIYLDSIIEAIKGHDPINKNSQKSLITILNRYISHNVSLKQVDLQAAFVTSQLDSPSIEATINNKYSSEGIRLKRFFDDKLILKIENYNIDRTAEEEARSSELEFTNTSIYVDQNRINDIVSIQTPNFDFSKLIKLCEELNIANNTNCVFAIPSLVREIMDHIPPLFGKATFIEVANNYSGNGKSFKKSMQNLENSLRNIADSHLHQMIRKNEVLPNLIQVDFKSDLDLLLSEIIRKHKNP